MTQEYKVSNKSAGRVVYSVPELGVRREFTTTETKTIPLSELQALSMRPGGRELIYNYLYIHDVKAIENIMNDEIAPEYFLEKEKVPSWMTSCSLDEFKDALDFAPEGTKDLIKHYAVTLPLTDMNKCNAIKEQLGFDVAEALKRIEDYKDDSATEKATSQSSRRRTTSSIQIPTTSETATIKI